MEASHAASSTLFQGLDPIEKPGAARLPPTLSGNQPLVLLEGQHHGDIASAAVDHRGASLEVAQDLGQMGLGVRDTDAADLGDRF